MSGFGINHSLYAAREKWREAERARHEEARKVAEAEAPGRAKEIEGRILAEVDASPNKIVVIVARGHADNAPGSVHASDVPFPPLPADKRWDHAAIAYKN
jgi:hypothetical protein